MTPLIIIATIAAYFILLFGVSCFASRNSSNAAFFTAGRHTAWPIVAIATIGAAISGVTFISVPGMVQAKSYSYLQMALGFIVGYILIAHLLLPLFYKRNLLSIYGYLEQRFGAATYRTGAWFFFISKMLGAAVRFYVVCIVLQELVCRPLGIPFCINVTVTIAGVWLYTFRGGLKSVIWTDLLKSTCLILSVLLSIIFIADNLGFTPATMLSAIDAHPTSRIFFFDNPTQATYFWKQFLAGIFMVIAMTGLDQDMMQRNLACADHRKSRKNMMVATLMQTLVILLFLILGTLMLIYIERTPSLSVPDNSDEIFGLVATHPSMPLIVGILFILGLISSSYSAAGSALTALTTSFTVDILHGTKLPDARLTRLRRRVHAAMAIIMALVIILFYLINEDDAISAVYTLASYTYGPILGLFAFGISSRRAVRDRWVPLICLLAPCLCWGIRTLLLTRFQYHMSFELLILNAALTYIGLWLLTDKNTNINNE